MNLADMRADYQRNRLRREDLKSDRIEQSQLWLEEACRAGVTEPTAMSLATAGSDGRPLLRTVLLKGLDNRGFVFFTNLESRKADKFREIRMFHFFSRGSCSNAKSSSLGVRRRFQLPNRSNTSSPSPVAASSRRGHRGKVALFPRARFSRCNGNT